MSHKHTHMHAHAHTPIETPLIKEIVNYGALADLENGRGAALGIALSKVVS